MGTYSAPGVAAALDEKNYSDYDLLWSTLITYGGSSVWVWIIDSLGGFMFIINTSAYLTVLRLSDGAETSTTSNYNTGYCYNQFPSVRSRYTVHNRADQIEVWRGGTLLRSIPMTGGYSLAGWAISQDGQYVAFCEYSGANYYVRCYKGRL